MRISDWSSDVCSSDLVPLRIEENLDVPDIVRIRTLAIGGGQVGEILFGMEDAHSLIIDVEKILEVREGIGGAHLLHRSEGDGDLVALRELEHQFGFERPFDLEIG